MNFEEVLACLENTQKCKEFILRLKNAGENSAPFLNVQSAMVELKMNKAPRDVDEKTILQHTLKFTDPDECFQSFRLVCKSWKDAVETIKFNREVSLNIFRNINRIIRNGLPIPRYFEKYLQCFKKLDAPMQLLASENGHHIISLVLNNMQELNYIYFDSGWQSLSATVDPFILQMLENSHKTLQYVYISRFSIPTDIFFPKLKTLEIEIGIDICLPEFKKYFPLVLKNMERLQTVKLYMDGSYVDICKYIGKNYGKYCISANEEDEFNMLNMVPVKILINVFDLKVMHQEDLQNFKYVSGLQYLHVTIHSPEDSMSYGWDKYQETLDQCLNLKEVELTWWDEDSNKITLSQISEANQNVWQERISYFKARGIRIVDDGEIYRNENLETKLAKESGVTWKFEFY